MCFEPDIPEPPAPVRVTAPEADPEDVTDRVQRNAERANTRDSLRRDPALKVPSETGISIG